MPTAHNIVPPRFTDGRREAIDQGLKAAGYDVHGARQGVPDSIRAREARPASSEDVLVTWNLHLTGSEAAANTFEAAGARVIVCEEAYTRRLVGEKHFAVALGGHNGSGEWFPGGAERWDRLGLEIKPWRCSGEHILVCSQRGMGSKRMRQPRTWPADVMRRLARVTDRPIVHRGHPGKRYHETVSLKEQLENAWAVVIWASNCGIEALLEGVPVFYEAPHLVTGGACVRGIDQIDDLETHAMIRSGAICDRLRAFRGMAWAQWTLEEISSGEAFRHLLRTEG